MHFDIDLDQRLTAAISPTYDVGNYAGAIIAALQLLSDVIRNKSGLETDGQALVGQAFGGSTPIIKLNPLRTESERDEQKGVEQIIRGIYTGIRNPRSHEIRIDSIVTANTIIAFVNWLLVLIDGSKSPFDPDDIIEKVLDEHYVPFGSYPALLASEVPPRIRLDVLVRLLGKVSFARAANARSFVNEMLKLMNDSERNAFWDSLSKILIASSGEGELMTLVRLISTNWLHCSEIARLRTENRLIKSVKEGRVDKAGRVGKGWAGVRAIDIESQFTMKTELKDALSAKIRSSDSEQRQYVYRYFMEQLGRLESPPSETTRRILLYHLSKQDSDTYQALLFVGNLSETDPWHIAFGEAVSKFEYADDDIPF